MGFHDLSDGLVTIHLRHVDIHCDYIRFYFQDHLDRFVTVPGHAHNLDIRVRAQDVLQKLPRNQRVVYNEDSYHVCTFAGQIKSADE
jgi:hypothetical protein